MTRLFTPALLFIAAASVFVYNQRLDRQVVFPFLDRLSPSPYVQGDLTIGILVVLGLLALGLAIFGIVRERRSAD